MLPILQLGPLSLPVPAILLLLGFWLGAYLAEKSAPRFGIEAAIIERISWIGLLAGLIGARLSFLAQNPGAFRGQWLSLLSLNPSFLNPASGVLIGIFAMLILILREDKRHQWKIVDNLMIFASAQLVVIFLSRFAAGTGAGVTTSVPWGIYFLGSVRHPVQLYFALMALIGFLVITLPRFDRIFSPGYRTAALLSYTASYLLLFSRYQVPGILSISGIRQDQIIYWLLLLFGMITYHVLTRDENG